MTVGTMQAIKEAGLSIPNEISVVAFDDHPYTPMLSPAPTVIDIDLFNLGVHAGNLLLKKSARPGNADSNIHRTSKAGTTSNYPPPERVMRQQKQEGFHWGILRGGMGSVAELFMAQLQDYLGLGAEARINIPGEPVGNWQWRLLPDQLTAKLACKLAEMARIYGR